jgi:LysM repeat protein
MRGWLSRFSVVVLSLVAMLNVGLAAMIAVQEQGLAGLPTSVVTANQAGSTPTALGEPTGGLVPTREAVAPTEGMAVAAVSPTLQAAVIFVPPVEISPSPVTVAGWPPVEPPTDIPASPTYAGPAVPVAPATSAPRTGCTRPAKWVKYIVQPGDTLTSLAYRLGTSVSTLKKYNCLKSDRIYAGSILWVPRPLYPSPTSLPRPTRMPTPRHSATPAPTLTHEPRTGPPTEPPTPPATPPPPETRLPPPTP